MVNSDPIPSNLNNLYLRNKRLIADGHLEGCPHVIVQLIERIGRDEAPVSLYELAKYSRKMEDGFPFFNAGDVDELIAARAAGVA
jgi:hypothetical protein